MRSENGHAMPKDPYIQKFTRVCTDWREIEFALGREPAGVNRRA